ncbi:hypothetical protein B0H13DRAFT_2055446 [Mycena leptocephala]|nr:hypothetical protein B0H13DRAFT_2055446 [Mycena leptocephala]
MLPVTDFNFVVSCGFATLAATVGYACARKARPLPSRASSQLLHGDRSKSDSAPEVSSNMVLECSMGESDEKSMEESDSNSGNAASEPASQPALETGTLAISDNIPLKRKRTQDEEDIDPDMGYPHNLKSIYPNKRRSGSVSDTEATKEMIPEPCDSSTNEEPHSVTNADIPEPVSSSPNPATDSVLPGPASSEPPLDTVEGSSSPETPKPEPVSTEVPRFVFPKTPPRIIQFPSSRTTASPGFANFAGSSSPFFSMSSSKDTTFIASRPIWASTTAVEATGASLDGESEGKTDSLPALAAAKTSTLAIQTHLTGEEDEDAILELKGVKMYVKRGEDNFSGGMVGHIKLLSHKTTLSQRLLFRREPLWKVSMNVRMQPTVRCTFDAQENIMRVALKELQDKSDSESAAPQTVIYAFKPSRSCKRSDFQDFAEALLAQARQGGQS